MVDYVPLYIVFSFVFLLGYVELRMPTRDRHLVATIAIFILVIFLSVREPGFGGDDLGYLQIFRMVSIGFTETEKWFGYDYKSYNIEFGYFLLLALLSQIGVFSCIIFGANGLLSLGGFYRASTRFFPYFVPALLVYMSNHFLTKDLNALRLALASSLVAYGASFLVKRRLLHSLSLVVAASFFQVSALLGLVPAILYFLNFRKNVLLIGASGLIVINLIYPFSNVLHFVPMFDFMQYKFELYDNAEMFNFSLALWDPVNIKNIALVALGYSTLSRLSQFNSEFRVALLFFFCGSLFRILFSDFAIIGGRGWAVLSVFECWVIAILVTHYFGRNRGYFLISGYAFCTMNFYLYSNTQWRGDVGFFG